MDALILTCGTGGGHNTCAEAIAGEMRKRGHNAVIKDPYEFVSHKLATDIGGAYTSLVRVWPGMFGFVYSLGELYRHLPIHSPIYAANKHIAKAMEPYLAEHDFDMIFCTNLLPELVMAAYREMGGGLPPEIYVDTDYTCVPFTEEGSCDYCVIPSAKLDGDYTRWGIDGEKLLPFGIPVREQFKNVVGRDEAIRSLHLDENFRYIMLMGGSIGAGHLKKNGHAIAQYMDMHPKLRLIYVCGSNKKLYRKIKKICAGSKRVVLIAHTDRVAEYMAASDVLISKPGGLSSTEAAVVGVPLIHLAPIPGCETKNRKFFSETGMSIPVRTKRQIFKALDSLLDLDDEVEGLDASEEAKDGGGSEEAKVSEERVEGMREEMLAAQRREINPHSAEDICDFAIKAAREARTNNVSSGEPTEEVALA